MSIMKDLFIEEYELLLSEAEESGAAITEELIAKVAWSANERSNDRFRDMCDEAKDRAEYQD